MPLRVAEAKAIIADKGQAVYPERRPLVITARRLPGEPLPAARAVDGAFEPFDVGSEWGGMWSTTWFRFQGQIPDEWGRDEVVALIHLGGGDMVGFSAEGMVWDAGLRPLQGLHHEHREVPIAESAVDFYVEAAANPVPRWHKKEWPLLDPHYDGPPLYVLQQAELATVDRQLQSLLLDATIAAEIAEWMNGRGLTELEEALLLLNKDDRDGARKCLARLLASGDEGSRRHTITAVGHAHIDTAWLWPVRETKRKCARSFANQLRLLETCSDHRFVCSQAVQYQWMKDDYPELYSQIREAVEDGRWEPVGGMWVEADANLPSGESLIRQIVHGKRFFRQEFGVETHEMWIPDVFGYPAALPQIAAQSGIRSLVTQKMSWNDTNVFPHSSFWWEGHDGSRIVAHFPPANTYNGSFLVAELLGDQRNFKDADRSDITLYPYGYGDGGGGPTREMIERARRFADIAGLPKVRIGSAEGFLSELERQSGALKTWVGELYLEYHRGTYTTHADVKRANRRGEEALRQAEMWSVATRVDRRRQLADLWKLLLVNQFHDILPGSSIHWVYEDTAKDHAAVLAGATELIDHDQAKIAGNGDELIAFNPSSFDRQEVVELPSGELSLIRVGGCSWSPLSSKQADSVEIGDRWIDNGILRVTWSSDGHLASIWDHEAGRHALAGPGNVFHLHDDNPKAFDAWDVDREYLDSVVELTDVDSVEPVEHNALRCAVRIIRSFGGSRIDQIMRLSAGSRRLAFLTEVDWHENHKFLKVAFPVAVRSMRASYEIQHGYVERPTVANTSWDEAQFEVCAHRWADLSEPGYGVALLNDCKYGYDIRGNTIRLSLLRAPGYPDPEADRGHHRFAYALLPHIGDLREGRVVEEAEAFNLPITLRPGQGQGQVVRLDRAGVSVEAVKRAEEGDGIVVRVCEVHGAHGPVTVTVDWPWSRVERVDLLERPLEALSEPTVALRPFELATLLFT